MSKIKQNLDKINVKFWEIGCLPLAIIFLILMIAISSIPVLAIGLTGGIVVKEIFTPPPRTPAVPKKVTADKRHILESHNIKSCRERPPKSKFSNQVRVKAGGQNFIVFCNPKAKHVSECCYIE